MTYLLTFACYGWHLPGQEGTVDRRANAPETRLANARPGLHRSAQLAMKYPAYEIPGGEAQSIVLHAIREVCHYRGWLLLAAHVRTNHVHIVVDAEGSPEVAMNSFKSYASRALNARFPEDRERSRWARHGSTRYLWTAPEIEAAVRYVMEKQGLAMASYAAPQRSNP